MSEEIAPKTPLLIHVALILAALNLVIVLWFYVSPKIGASTRLNAIPQTHQVLADKTSPFEPYRIEVLRNRAKLPRKLEPVFDQFIPESTIPPSASDN